MTVSNRLSEILKEKQVTQICLAEHIGVAQTTMNTWIKRNIDIPAQHIMPICRYLDVTPQYLLEGDASSHIPTGYVCLSDDERFLIDTLRALDREGMHVVVNKAIEEHRRVRAAQGDGESMSESAG